MREIRCSKCEYNKSNHCKMKDKMSIEEYEDYFIDRVKKCPYFIINKRGDNYGEDSRI